MNLSLSGWHFIWATHACMLSRFSRVQLFETCQALCSLPGSSNQEFSSQEYWSGLPCPSPGDLPYPGIEPCSLKSPALAGIFFTTSTTKAMHFLKTLCSRFCVKQTSKSKLRPKKKKRERAWDGGGCQEDGKGKKKIRKSICQLKLPPPSLVAQKVKNCLQRRKPTFEPWVWKIP